MERDYNFIEYFVIKYLTVLPTPPPKKTKIKDFISKL